MAVRQHCCRRPDARGIVVRRKDAYPWLQIGCSRCEHGAYCVGCCWALMLLLFVGGVMNLIWVAFLATIVLVEKVLPSGVTLARFAGVVLIVCRIALLARPLILA